MARRALGGVEVRASNILKAVPISSRPRSDGARDLVAQLLSDQQLLTPVADFARKHARHEFAPGHPTHRELLPLTPLVPGEQYAFEVELDRCSGCKACVTACHSLNGLDETETWRDVGLLISAPSKPWREAPPFQQTVTTACHHCVEPACLEGCPVLAYEKDSVTGIVRHLDDQCIGCQYCVLKCPYDVPKYNARLGIVRKCDMCSSRLTAGEAPACAQACPNEAIRITKVSKSEITSDFREQKSVFLQDAPAGDYTLPTTRYLNASTVKLAAADAAEVTPQPAHWPLVLMLVLTQASVGTVAAALLETATAGQERLLCISTVSALLGLGASVFHLGRPLGAWRAFLNLKRSWMSREIVAFGFYFGVLAATSTAAFFNWMPSVVRAGSMVATLAGLGGVFCSAMIYADTRRDLWLRRRSVTLFFFTTILLGAAASLLVSPTSPLILALLAIATSLKIGAEILVLRHASASSLTPMKKSALLVIRRFQPVAFGHLIGLAVGGIGIPVLLGTTLPSAQWLAAGGLLLLLLAELGERYLFFRCVVAPKMPGGMK